MPLPAAGEQVSWRAALTSTTYYGAACGVALVRAHIVVLRAGCYVLVVGWQIGAPPYMYVLVRRSTSGREVEVPRPGITLGDICLH